MASWSDYFSLVVTISLFAAAAYGVIFVSRQWSIAMQSTKNSLKKRGLDVSDHGVSVKGKTKLADREEYCDATQRGFIKMLGSSHYGPSSEKASDGSPRAAHAVLNSSGRLEMPTHDGSTHSSPTPSFKSLNGEEKRRWLSRK